MQQQSFSQKNREILWQPGVFVFFCFIQYDSSHSSNLKIIAFLIYFAVWNKKANRRFQSNKMRKTWLDLAYWVQWTPIWSTWASLGGNTYHFQYQFICFLKCFVLSDKQPKLKQNRRYCIAGFLCEPWASVQTQNKLICAYFEEGQTVFITWGRCDDYVNVILNFTDWTETPSRCLWFTYFTLLISWKTKNCKQILIFNSYAKLVN